MAMRWPNGWTTRIQAKPRKMHTDTRRRRENKCKKKLCVRLECSINAWMCVLNVVHICEREQHKSHEHHVTMATPFRRIPIPSVFSSKSQDLIQLGALNHLEEMKVLSHFEVGFVYIASSLSNISLLSVFRIIWHNDYFNFQDRFLESIFGHGPTHTLSSDKKIREENTFEQYKMGIDLVPNDNDDDNNSISGRSSSGSTNTDTRMP